MAGIDLLALDASFQPVAYLSYINLQWNRKYYEPGDFVCLVPAAAYSPAMKYLYTTARPELGMIQKVEYVDQQVKGDFITLSGFFYEKILDDKILWPSTTRSGNIETVIRGLVTDYKSDIPNLHLGPIADLGESISFSAIGEELGARIRETLQTQELAYRVTYDYAQNKAFFSVWQGLDRTQEQADNPWAVFSSNMGSIVDVRAMEDESNYKNYAQVKGHVEYTTQVSVVVLNEETGQEEIQQKTLQISYDIYTTVDRSNGGYKKMIFLDAGNGGEDFGTDDLAQKGNEELDKYLRIVNVEFKPDVGKLTYLTDYDLGDKCDLIVDQLQLSYQARIIEIHEVFKANNHTFSLVVGDRIPTIYERVKLQ